MQHFIARSESSKKLLNTLRISANLPVNILIVGERGSGKRTLAKEVFEDLDFYTPAQLGQLQNYPSTLGIEEIESVRNLASFFENLQGRRIIALAEELHPEMEEYFPVILHLPPLSQRPEDFEALKSYYIQQAKKDLELGEFACEVPRELNAIELRKEIYKKAVLKALTDEEVMEFLEGFFEKKLPDEYKSFVKYLDVPLLKAAKKRYGSVLAMAKALRLNRATLTTKLKKYGLKNEG